MKSKNGKRKCKVRKRNAREERATSKYNKIAYNVGFNETFACNVSQAQVMLEKDDGNHVPWKFDIFKKNGDRIGVPLESTTVEPRYNGSERTNNLYRSQLDCCYSRHMEKSFL